jgi:hypothetical protein
MTPEHKERLRQARAQAREARKNAVDAEVSPFIGEAVQTDEKYGGAEASEIETLRAELAALKDKHREKAAHEHETITGREKINDPGKIGGAQANVEEALRKIVNEQLAETFPERQPIRKTARESMRPGATVAMGRDGQPLYRKRDQLADPFALPEDLLEPGWSYQWCRVSTFGQEDLPHQIGLQENGWRFVQADSPRWRGRMMPADYQGAIFRDGLALMERPASLTEEAQREASRRVKEQSQAQRQQFGLALPQGFSDRTESARANTFARQGRAEPVPDSLRPTLQPSMDID